MMEKLNKPKARKKISKKLNSDLSKNIPSAPLLEEFIVDDVKITCEDLAKVNEEPNLENELCKIMLNDDEERLQSHQKNDDRNFEDKLVEKPKKNETCDKIKIEDKSQLHINENCSKNDSLASEIQASKSAQDYNMSSLENSNKSAPLYPDLSNENVLKPSEYLQNYEVPLKKIEEISVCDFHENFSKIPLMKHVCDFIHKFLHKYDKFIDNDRFYYMMKEYLKSKTEINSVNDRISEISKHCSNLRDSIWTIENCVIVKNNICKDNINVSVTYEYRNAKLHQSILDDLERNSKKLREICHKDYINIAHKTLEIKHKIEHFIAKTVNKINEAESDIVNIQLCISVLFYFIRKYDNETLFIQDIKLWMDILVKKYLDCDIHDKELFLLNHILRCPPGISWAIKYFQCPQPIYLNAHLPNSNVYLCFSFLYIILSPIEKREDFSKLRDHDIGTSKMISSWILVDSDGEDEPCDETRPLKESDIILLINQIPFEILFSSILIHNKENNLNANELCREFITFIKFCTNLVFILSKGLNTYNISRYSSLSMLLGRLIKHTLDYATEEFKIYKSQFSYKSVEEEYDSFCIRVVQSILWSNNCCKWQLLSTMTWEHISARSLWCLFDHIYDNIEERDWALHKKEINEYEIKYEREDQDLVLDRINSLSQNEQYFFLHTLSNMAAQRSIQDITFIIKIVDLMIKVGFSISNSSNSKWARIYISSICEQYPQICSYIISKINLSPSVALYLFQEIKLQNWNLNPYDISRITYWLLNFDTDTSENKLGRHLLSNLNYGIQSFSGQPFLDINLHFDIGLIIVRSCLVHDKNNATRNKNAIAESIKNVTKMVWSSASNNYHRWCFETLLKLKIHCLSQSDDICKSCCLPSKYPLKNITEIERYEDVMEGVNECHPVACYFALLATTWGHSVPIIYSKGLPCLKVLEKCNEYEAVIHLLYLIVPLFLDCQEELIENPIFTDILNGLVQVSFSEKFFGSAAQVLHIADAFNNMIMYQIMSFSRYALPNPSQLITFWLKCILKLDWNNNSVTYILNNISQMVYIFPNSQKSADDIVKSLFTNTLSDSKSLFEWIYSSENIMTYSNLEAPWFEKIIIQMKHYITERSSNLWQEIIEQINIFEGKLNLEKAIKKAESVINTNVINEQLCVYRWADLGLKIPIENPIAPLIWQQFFYMLLERQTMSNGRTCCFGLNFLTNSSVNQKSLLEHFEKAQKVYSHLLIKLQTESEEEEYTMKSKMQLYHNLIRLYGLFRIWITDDRIFDANFELTNLASHYEPHMIFAFMTNNYECMVPFIDICSINNKIMTMVTNFEKRFVIGSYKSQNTYASQTFSDLKPEEKIKAKLSSYETPIDFDEIATFNNYNVKLPEEIANNLSATKKYLHKHFQLVSRYARNYSNRLLEHKSLDYTLLDLYPLLYENVLIKKKVMANCSSVALYDRLMRRDPKPCAGPVEIILEYTDLLTNESVQKKIQRDINSIENLISSTVSDMPTDLYLATATIEEFVRIICQNKTSIGKDLFYFILELYYKERHGFFPLDNLFETCLADLSKAFYYNDDISISELFTKIEYNINYLPLISNFLPIEYLTPAGFVMIYSCICKCSLSFDDKIILLRRFDLDKWITITTRSHVHILDLLYVMETSILGFSIINTEKELYEIHKILVRHMMCIYKYNYPNYYWYILDIILKGLDNLNISSYCLQCFINEYCLDQKVTFYEYEVSYDIKQLLKIKHNYRSRAILLDTCTYLYKYFLTQRLQNGVYGLYSKYQKYVKEIRNLLGTVTCCAALVLKDMIDDHVALNVKQTVSAILAMWGPWLLPLWLSRLSEKPPDWVQQLTMDGPLLPCSTDDSQEMNKMMLSFVDCCLVLDNHVKDADIACYLLNLYIGEICYPKIPNYIINHINTGLLKVSWKIYKVQANDVLNMHRILLQFLPDNHYFIGQVFSQIDWRQYLQPLWKASDKLENINLLAVFIDLLVHIAYEPSLRNKNCMLNLIEELMIYNWSIINCSTVEALTNWFVLTSNPLGLISNTADYATDISVMRIIECTVGLKSDNLEYSKLFALTRAKVKLLDIIGKRNLATDSTSKLGFQTVVENLVDLSHDFVNNKALYQENKEIALVEGSDIFKEIFTLLNTNELRLNYRDITQTAVINCIGRGMQKNCIKSILRVISNITNEAVNGMIMEQLLLSYFSTIEDGSMKHWDILNQEIGKIFVPSSRYLATRTCLMSLHLYYMRLTSCSDPDEQTKNLQKMLDNLHYISPNLDNEQFLPLLWFDILQITSNFNSSHKTVMVQYISNFCEYLEKMAESSVGILEIIKFKRSSISEKFRLLCKILQTFLLSKMCVINNELELKYFNRNLDSYENVPKFEVAKSYLLSRKSNGVEKILLDKGLEYINNDTDFNISLSTVLKSLLIEAYENPFYTCL